MIDEALHAAERFNQESRRVPEVLRRVPLLQRAAPIRPATVVGVAALVALALVLVPPVVQSSPAPTPTIAPMPAFGRGVVTLTATPAPTVAPAPTCTPTLIKRMYTERYLRNSLRLAALGQDAVRDLDVRVEEPNRVVVTGTLGDPPVKLRIPLLIGLSAEGKVRLSAGAVEALEGGRVPAKVTAGLPKRLEELNAQVAQHVPGGPIFGVWVQGDRVVFEVEEA